MAYGSFFFSGQLGAIGAFLLARKVIETMTHFNRLYLPIMIVYGAVSLFTFGLSFTLPNVYPTHTTNNEEDDSKWIPPPKASPLNQPHLILHIIIYIFVSGPNWTISSLLSERLTDFNYGDDTILLAWLLFNGVALLTPLIIGRVMDATHQYRLIVFTVMLLVTIAYVPWILTFQYRLPCLCLTALLGLVTGANTTMYVECAIELAYPLDAKYWAPLMIYFAQIWALMCTVFASYHVTNQYAIWSFGSIFAAATIALGIGLKYNAVYARFSSLTSTPPPSPPSSSKV